MTAIDPTKELAGQFEKLPPVVQHAITGAHTEEHLRKLSEKHQLHLDQWQVLENEVMLTLFGLQPISELSAHIEKEVGVTHAVAQELTLAISEEIFEPIRQELERELEHPEAQEKEVSAVDAMATNALAGANPDAPVADPLAPETVVVQKVERPTPSQTYRPGQLSHERKDVHSDPYRETP
ncbi:MAG: hypothetical protein KBE09_00670 [Candidatus Pacebacteria bacterium]|nr:hypothetical protein [Candidatus Paceibacterota bacterium]